jgi:hypothetical protein
LFRKQSTSSNNSSNVTPAVDSTAPVLATPAATTTTSGGDNRIDYDAITDVMGYAGVDLKEEAEHFLKDGGESSSHADGVDRSKSQDFMNGRLLQHMVTRLAQPLAITHIDPDVVSYLSLATQARLKDLMEEMVKASKHRIERRSPFQRLSPNQPPLYKIVVRADPALTATAATKGPWQLTSKVPPHSAVKRFYPVDDDDNDNLRRHRKVTVVDAIFALERNGQSGKGSGQKTLLKTYNHWLQ